MQSLYLPYIYNLTIQIAKAVKMKSKTNQDFVW